MTDAEIARVCHQVNVAYCQALGESTQGDWDEAPEWQRESTMRGVKLHREGEVSVSATHESWMDEKIAEGWIHGDVKHPEFKTHPCILPFDLLPTAQQAKDYIFKAIVDALK